MYNNLDQTYWITKNGEKLNPLTDMNVDHIVNVMNMLQDRAKKNEERNKLLSSVLSEYEFMQLRNKTPDTDMVTLETLNETTLFKLLTQGLKNAVLTGNFERSPNYEIPRQISNQDYEPSYNQIRDAYGHLDWYDLK